jgi:PAS domain S-box-containing protein
MDLPSPPVAGDLRAFISEASISIAMFDREMRYLAASQRWIDHVCHGERDVIGRWHYEVNPEIPEHWRDAHRRGLAGKKTGADREPVQGRDGSTVWVRWEVCPWRDFEGTIGGITVLGEVLTAIVEAEQSLQQKLAIETKTMTSFYDAALRLWNANDLQEGLEQALDGAMDLLDADMGSIQLLDRGDAVLRMVAQRSFNEDFVNFFAEISAAHETACGRALRAGGPIVVEDTELDPGPAEIRALRNATGYRAVVSVPLMNSGGTLFGMLSAHFRQPHRPSASELQWLDLHRRRTADFIANFRSAQALRESEERLRLAVTASRMGMFDWDMRTKTFLWSDEWYRMLGYQVGEVEPSQDAWLARVHPDDRERAAFSHENTRLHPKEFSSEYRIIRGDGDVRWIRTHGRYLFENGKPVRLIGLKEDVTEGRRQIDTQRVLVAELQHRTRNLMAVVQSIAHQTLDKVESLGDFEERFNHRLEALSRVQGLLSRAEDDPITLGALVMMELEVLGSDGFSDRIRFGGPEAPLNRSAVEMLALAIHELLTNAIKYGALAGPTGLLSIAWRIDGTEPDPRVVLEWTEHGVDHVRRAAPARSGYGRTLIEQALPYSLSAETTFEFGADGLRCRISLPLVPTGSQ